ncbi:MAG: TetR/AcrR family transcriptional regulator [Candidatus Hermodarchaeota archaeon]
MANERKKRIQQRKEREKEQRRHEIIIKAMDCFISKGFDNTTMDEIALKASLSKGTLYNYFDSKNDLYLVVGTIAIRKLNEYYEAIDMTSKSDMERLLTLGYAIYEFSKNFPELYKIASDIRKRPFFLNITQKVIEGASLTRNEKEINFEILRYQKTVLDPIREGIDNKIIRDDLTPIFLIATLTSLTEGLIDSLRNFKPLYESLGINTDDIFDLVFEWITEGIKPKKKEEK